VTKDILNSGKIFKEFYDGIIKLDSTTPEINYISNFAKNKINSLKKIIDLSVFVYFVLTEEWLKIRVVIGC
jgi:hypothetical protein